MRGTEEKMARVAGPDKSTRQSAGDEDKQKSRDQFPLQSSAHCKKSV
jgi:hypothetical protein